jgi:hypothetical protein
LVWMSSTPHQWVTPQPQELAARRHPAAAAAAAVAVAVAVGVKKAADCLSQLALPRAWGRGCWGCYQHSHAALHKGKTCIDAVLMKKQAKQCDWLCSLCESQAVLQSSILESSRLAHFMHNAPPHLADALFVTIGVCIKRGYAKPLAASWDASSDSSTHCAARGHSSCPPGETPKRTKSMICCKLILFWKLAAGWRRTTVRSTQMCQINKRAGKTPGSISHFIK